MKWGKGELVNKSRCCSLFGWSRPTFDKQVRDGMPVVEHPADKGGEYKVYLGEVAQWLRGQAHKADDETDDEKLDSDAELARLRKEQRVGQALKNAISRGELIPAEEVVEGWQAAVGRARSLLRGIGPACAEDVCILAVQGPAAVREHLVNVIDEALEELKNTRVDDLEDEEVERSDQEGA